jgi:hypothetical protein
MHRTAGPRARRPGPPASQAARMSPESAAGLEKRFQGGCQVGTAERRGAQKDVSPGTRESTSVRSSMILHPNAAIGLTIPAGRHRFGLCSATTRLDESVLLLPQH